MILVDDPERGFLRGRNAWFKIFSIIFLKNFD